MPDIVLFLQDPMLTEHWREYLHMGVIRFLYDEGIEEGAFRADMAVVADKFRNRDWEVVRVNSAGAMLYRRGHDPERLPVWSAFEESLERLGALLRGPAPRYVLVRALQPANPGAGHTTPKTPKVLIEKLTVASELVRDAGYPFVAFGLFHFGMMHSGLFDGYSVRAWSRAPKEYRNRMHRTMPDGKTYPASPVSSAVGAASSAWCAWIEREHGMRTRTLRRQVVRAIIAVQAAPYYQERLLELEQDQEYDPASLLPPSFFIGHEHTSNVVAVRNETPPLHLALPGDRITCDTCSLRYRCSFFQKGGVCVMPGTDGKALVDFFGSRDANEVLEGMRALIRKKAERVEGAVEAEDKVNDARAVKGEPRLYSDQVTKMLTDLERSTENFLKLTDPRFARGPLVQINQQNNLTAPHPPKLGEVDYGAAIDKLVEMGFERESITPDHVQRVIEGRMLPGALSEPEVNDVIDDVGF